MSHLGERITDFVFGEMPAAEMAEAKRHLSECGECRQSVEQFERTTSFLRTSVDLEPPRPILFEVQKPKPRFAWNWLVPSAVAAAVMLVAFIAAPIQAQWQGSQLTITFGRALPATAAPVTTTTQAAVVQPPAAPSVQQVAASNVDENLRAWLNGEFKKHDSVRDAQIQATTSQMQGEWNFLKDMQLQTQQQTSDLAANLQKVAGLRGDSGN